MSNRMFGAVAVLAAACLAVAFGGLTPALAGLGEPTPGELGLQLPASPIMQELNDLFSAVNIILVAITPLRCSSHGVGDLPLQREEQSHPVANNASTPVLEVAWTILPILILVGISIPSFHLLFNQYAFPKPDLTIKVTGNAWFWDNEYLDQKVTITSNIVNDEDVIRAKIGDEELRQEIRLAAGYSAPRRIVSELRYPYGRQIISCGV